MLLHTASGQHYPRPNTADQLAHSVTRPKNRSPAPHSGDAGLMTMTGYGCAGASDGATDCGGCEGPRLAEPPGPPGPPWKPAPWPWCMP